MWYAFQSELSRLFAFIEQTCGLHLFSWRSKILLSLMEKSPPGRAEEVLLLPFPGALPPPDGQRGVDRDTPGALPLSPGTIFQLLLGSTLPSIGWCYPHSIIPLQTLYIKSSQLLLPESLGGVYCLVLICVAHSFSLLSFLFSAAWGAALQESLGYAKPTSVTTSDAP